MRIDIYSSHRNINIKDIKERNVVVIDVLRTSSTLIGAFANGLVRFLVVDDPIKAPDYTEDLDNDRVLMGGVENYNFITGFDIGDSVFEYDRYAVKGKELIYYNRDSSPAIKKGYRGKRLFLGAFVNMHAVAEKLVELKDDVALVCAGTNGNFSLEDGLAAGGIIKEIRSFGIRPDLSEYAFVMDRMYSTYQNKLEDAIKRSITYEKLVHIGCEGDIEHALKKNTYDFAPTLFDNWITKK